MTEARLLVANTDPHRLPLRRAGIGQSADSSVLRSFLIHLRELGGRTLIVEADVEEEGDMVDDEWSNSYFVIGNRVERWISLDSVGVEQERLLRTAMYPLNGFISILDLSTVLHHGAPDPHRLAASVIAVITQSFDGEAYVGGVLTKHERSQ
ncbi:hypothetical protein VD659_03845 [Herbiconiux sp. 11R-BC]|uniref:hypothetical protein n=1 Tax=Herbiconiux sp. 11R-BC TaxID=3111637 RepID=UPI003BFE0C71